MCRVRSAFGGGRHDFLGIAGEAAVLRWVIGKAIRRMKAARRHIPLAEDTKQGVPSSLDRERDALASILFSEKSPHEVSGGA